MMVLMFRERFVERIRSGKKTQTIRRPRASHPIQVEDWLSLRSPRSRSLLRRPPQCRPR